METDILMPRRLTAFRLSENLISRLRIAARKEHRSLNDYVETVLVDALYRTPNKITLEAMKEAEDVKYLETLDLDNFENYVASL